MIVDWEVITFNEGDQLSAGRMISFLTKDAMKTKEAMKTHL